MTGIYCITNRINGKRYVGSSINISKRFGEHKTELRGQRHINSYLQKSYNKYGEGSFTFDVVEECGHNKLIEREEYWIAQYDACNRELGYNFNPYPSRPRLGVKASPETLRRMSIANGGENHPMFGKHLKRETRRKLSLSQKGIPRPQSGRKKSYKVMSPNGQIIEIVGLRKFCVDNRLSLCSMFRLVHGIQRVYQNWQSVNFNK